MSVHFTVHCFHLSLYASNLHFQLFLYKQFEFGLFMQSFLWRIRKSNLEEDDTTSGIILLVQVIANLIVIVLVKLSF